MLLWRKNSLFTNYVEKLRNSKFRQVVWPIKSTELVKFIPMSLLMFTILLNQNIVRAMKDTVVVSMIGTESLSFIKLWFEAPVGVLFVILYSKMCNKMTTEKVFRVIVAGFLIFFWFFVYVVYPNQSFFHPEQVKVDSLIANFPHLKWFIIIWSKWSLVVFYIIGELWPIIVFSLLFWQLANKITKTEEAGRFYSFFTLFGQSNLFISGSLIMYLSSEKNFFKIFFYNLTDPTEIIFKSLLWVVMISGFLTLILHFYIEYKVMQDPKYFQPKNKTNMILKLSIKETLNIILSSQYLGFLFILIFSYSVTANLMEGIWLEKAKEFYSSTNEFMSYLGSVNISIGLMTLLFAFLGNTIIKVGGWYTAAIVTPLSTLVAGSLFYCFIIGQDKLVYLLGYPDKTILGMIVFLGSLQLVIAKSTKYSLFDTTKEMAYIPLDDEIKAKGKAAIDIVATKAGKSGGAFIQFMTFTIWPSARYTDITIYLMILFCLISFFWIYGVKNLSQAYSKLLK